MISTLILGGFAIILTYCGIMLFINAKKRNDEWAAFHGILSLVVIIFFLVFGNVKIYEHEIDISDKCIMFDINNGVCVEYQGVYYTDKSVSARKYKYDSPTVILYDTYTLFSDSKDQENYIKIKPNKKKKKVTDKVTDKWPSDTIGDFNKGQKVNSENQNFKKNITTLN